MFEGSAMAEGSGGDPEGSGMEENGNGEEDDEEGPLYYFLEESTGYMEPALAFLGILHTIISFLCIIGYNCLKVSETQYVFRHLAVYRSALHLEFLVVNSNQAKYLA